ncbi:YtxH domain-containing protein [Patescibacteria group bacterium]
MHGNKPKKGGCKLFKRIKLGIGLVTGVILGLLFAPKRGKEIRDYCTSEECQTKLHNAENKISGLQHKLRQAMKKIKDRFGSR